MLTRAQLVTELESRGGRFTPNRRVYLGAPSNVRTQSSTLALVNAVDAYNLAPNGGNLLNVITEIDQIPPAKKIRYQDGIAALQATFPHPIYVTSGPFTLHTVPIHGVGVPRAGAPYSRHQTDVIMAMRQLAATAQGDALIQAITAQIAVNGKRVSVHPWNAQATNNCYVSAPDNADVAKTTLALALEFQINNAGATIGAAATAAGHPIGLGLGGAAWLSGQIDACPIYDIQGVPAAAAASSATHGAGWVSPAMISNWVNGVAAFPAPLVGPQIQDAKVVIGAVLHDFATAGGGAHSGVRWSATGTQFTDTQGVVQVRPPYISLGHELVHAYHNQCGNQPGHEIGTYSRVLYEYLCVGLGPWLGAGLSENGIRAGIPFPARTCY